MRAGEHFAISARILGEGKLLICQFAHLHGELEYLALYDECRIN